MARIAYTRAPSLAHSPINALVSIALLQLFEEQYCIAAIRRNDIFAVVVVSAGGGLVAGIIVVVAAAGVQYIYPINVKGAEKATKRKSCECESI